MMATNDQPRDNESTGNVFSFSESSVANKNLVGAVRERGPFQGCLIVSFWLVGALGLGFYGWRRQDEEGILGWTVFLAVMLFCLLYPAFHYWRLVVEIRVTPRDLQIRRLTKFRSIPWENISGVKIHLATFTGISYVWVRGHSLLPLAFFPLWMPWYLPEKVTELNRLIEELTRRVPVKVKRTI
jgi:hypothetical protein